MLTAAALLSEARARNGALWRFVEAQSKASTTKTSDSLEEQKLLEEIIEEVKPPMPEAARRLHFLLSAPFRYAPYPHGSRFRRAGQREGAFYASECVRTAAVETAYYRLLFFKESPATKLPRLPAEHTAFQATWATEVCLDLQEPPLSRDRAAWEDLMDYRACQDLADRARDAGIETIRYRSVRDPEGGSNLALLSAEVFTSPEPSGYETWHSFIRSHGHVQITREFPPMSLEFHWSTED